MPRWPFKSARPPPVLGAPGPATASDPFLEVVQAISDPLMVIEAGRPLAGQRIVFANEAARRFFRITTDAPELVTVVRRPEVLEIIEAALDRRIPGEAEFESNDRVLRAVSQPLAAQVGNARALLVLQDETDARRTERMRADFLANASHELKTPLASLAGFIETLRGHARDDEAAREKFLSIMAAQAERMGRLIEDLMSLSRIELNEHVRPAGEADLVQVAGDVVDALQPVARKRGVGIEIVSAGTAIARADRDQLVQVVQNLADNAVKYSPVGAKVTIEVIPDLAAAQAAAPRDEAAARLSLLTPEHDPHARYVTIRVSDRGPGIPREHLPRLSERFYRTPGQKSGDQLGTGLGLAIVKHILNRHRGGLAVESAPGVGSSFIAYLPQSPSA